MIAFLRLVFLRWLNFDAVFPISQILDHGINVLNLLNLILNWLLFCNFFKPSS